MLTVCTACRRHTQGVACAFCGAAVAAPEIARTARGSRAAIFASVAAVGIACGARTDLGGGGGSEHDAAAAIDAARDCQVSVTVYGGPFGDAACSPIVVDAGSSEDVTVAPPYGLPPDE